LNDSITVNIPWAYRIPPVTFVHFSINILTLSSFSYLSCCFSCSNLVPFCFDFFLFRKIPWFFRVFSSLLSDYPVRVLEREKDVDISYSYISIWSFFGTLSHLQACIPLVSYGEEAPGYGKSSIYPLPTTLRHLFDQVFVCLLIDMVHLDLFTRWDGMVQLCN